MFGCGDLSQEPEVVLCANLPAMLELANSHQHIYQNARQFSEIEGGSKRCSAKLQS